MMFCFDKVKVMSFGQFSMSFQIALTASQSQKWYSIVTSDCLQKLHIDVCDLIVCHHTPIIWVIVSAQSIFDDLQAIILLIISDMDALSLTEI